MDTITKIRKVEFKVHLDTQQQQVFDHHSRDLRFVWNTGLACIQWREWWEKWQKVLDSPDRPGYAPETVPIDWSCNIEKRPKKKNQEEENNKKVYALSCKRVQYRIEKITDSKLGTGEWTEPYKDKNGKIDEERCWVAYPCKPDPVREHWTEEPRLPLLMKNPYMALRTLFAKKNWDPETIEGQIIHGLNTAWIAGECKSLGDAWSAYKKGVRERPRFKKRRDRSNLINPSSKQTKFTGNSLTLPGMGRITVKGLQQRWGDKPACPIALIKEGGDFYLQLTGEVQVPAVRSNNVTVGIDPGAVRLATLDNGAAIESPKFGEQALRRQKKLQNSINRKRRLNSDRVHDEADPSKFYLKPHKDWKQKNLQKVRTKLQRLSAKAARQRRAYNHFHSTRIVQSADVIIMEDLELKNVTRAVKKGKSGEHNKRKAKAGLNRSLLDNAIGQFYGMIEQKAKDAGKTTTRVNPFRTSMTCNKCGFSDAKNRKNQANFHCQRCGHRDNADHNAALNIKRLGVLGFPKLTFDDNWNITVPGWIETGDLAALHSKGLKPVGTDKKRSKRADPSQMALEIGLP
jgi:putative transposase